MLLFIRRFHHLHTHLLCILTGQLTVAALKWAALLCKKSLKSSSGRDWQPPGCHLFPMVSLPHACAFPVLLPCSYCLHRLCSVYSFPVEP